MTHSRAGLDSGGLRMPRSRGTVTGLILILLGAWGALIPFVGPYFVFAYTPGEPWVWTAARGWLEVLPGIATAVGGLLLVGAGNRATAMFGGWLAVLAGAWFVVGRAFSTTLGIGGVGSPAAAAELKRAWLEITYFSGLGALIVFLGGAALARVLVRHARDVQPVATGAAAPGIAGPGVVAQPEPWATSGRAPYGSSYGVPAAPPAPRAPARAEQAPAPESESEPEHHHMGAGLFRRRHVKAGS